MNRHSLLFQISLFFVLLLVLIDTLFFFQYKLETKQAKEIIVKRFHEAERILHMGAPDRIPPHEGEERLRMLLGMELVNNVDNIRSKKMIDHEEALSIYQDESYIYYLHEDKRHGHELLLRYKSEKKEQISPFILAFFVNGLLFLFYLYIVKKLKPLHQLKRKIVRFSEGELKIDLPQKGKDEIAEVSNEFNNAIGKIKSLQESRNLFLRNIMHELKMPIAKGKLISDLIDDNKNKERLRQIFSRFEYLLGEFTKIEQVTSNALIVNKKRFRVVDILDNAFDILLIESSDVDVEVNANLEIEADYELMSTALKNLIDNALKYGTGRTKIMIDEKNITIESYGKALENSSFETAFNRAFEDSSKGLGLGLYITHHIVKRHGFELHYEHAKGINRFRIHC